MYGLLALLLVSPPPVWESVDTGKLVPGYECTLGVPGREVNKPVMIYVAINDSSYRQYMKYKAAKDFQGIRAMKQRGDILQSVTGESVEVIEVKKKGEVEIRILTGDEKTHKGLIHPESLCTSVAPKG